MISLFAVVCGLIAWVFVRYILTSFYIIDQNQRAVLTNFGRAQRLGGTTTLELPIAESLGNEEKNRLRAKIACKRGRFPLIFPPCLTNPWVQAA